MSFSDATTVTEDFFKDVFFYNSCYLILGHEMYFLITKVLLKVLSFSASKIMCKQQKCEDFFREVTSKDA